MRQIVLDTETTGLATSQGHRIIEIGCIEIMNRRFTGREPSSWVILHTDSKYVKDGIESWMPNWKARGWKTANKKSVKNKDLWQALDEAAGRHELVWKWVKGHAGDPGNEEADALANRGIDEL